MGSPPRMRGKDILFLLIYGFIRITPAYAGKSTLETMYAPQAKDHPRVCGEKVIRTYPSERK